MLVEPKNKSFVDLVQSATKEELVWMHGYLAGLLSSWTGELNRTAPPASQTSQSKLTLLYGTETGNAKRLAGTMAAKARGEGLRVKSSGLDQYRFSDLEKEEYFFVIVSTHGEGEPPEAAKQFFDRLHEKSPRLDKLKYGVLALGDRAYPLFCKAGEDLDARLETLGAQRVAPLQKCDVDFEAEAKQWFENVLLCFRSPSAAGGDVRIGQLEQADATQKVGKKKMFLGTVLTNILLNDRGADKETHHIELAAEGVVYQPGDALGVVPENPPAVIEEILRLASAEPNEMVDHPRGAAKLSELLQRRLNIFYLPKRVVKKYADLVGQSIPSARIDLLDLLKIYPIKGGASFEDVVKILEPIAPRLYSIASSPEAHSGELHLTVARDRFHVDGKTRYGLCSAWLSRLKEGDGLAFYVQPNRRFKLPAPDKDIILIGPGTGIAPFRSFLAEREATGASGRNWLFFGSQRFETDFLYQTEIQYWLESGTLSRVDVAFSRDQPEKVYVQHKMWAQREAFFQWLEAGAYVYVCGVKDPMSVDVEKELLRLIGQVGRTAPEAYLKRLKEEDRYLKDIY